MASAKAMDRIDWTRTGVAAPGLRPTAIAAPAPIKPTPIAAPSAANPTCKLPAMTYLLRSLAALCGQRIPAADRSSSVCARGSRPFMLTDQQSKHRAQQHEHQRLHQAHEQLHEIKWNRQQPPETGDDAGHGLQHGFPGKDVAVEAKAERHRPKENRHDFETARGEEY